MTTTSPPSSARDVLIDERLRRRINETLANDKIAGGWLITGPPNVGKASLAFALATTLLSGAAQLGQNDPITVNLVSGLAHPDLFVLSRTVNEKTGRLRSEIGVDAVRTITAGLHRTSTSGRRVVVVDLAEDMGREAANALLKTLEEPPRGTTLFLLSAASGRLLPTIRSRCRRLTMAPVADDLLSSWLQSVHSLTPDEATDLSVAAGGRPGRAIRLAAGEGTQARNLAEALVSAAQSGRTQTLLDAAADIAAKDADSAWDDVRLSVLDTLSQRLRNDPLAPETPTLLDAYARIKSLSDRATALNSDRQHTVLSVGLVLRSVLGGNHAGR